MTIAVVLDYDKTLSPHHMQEDTLFSKWGILPEEFWSETTRMVRDRGYDRELAWMWHLLDFEAFRSLRPEDLRALGKGLVFYPGVPGFFDEIPGVEFYIITAGLLEILEGSSLAGGQDIGAGHPPGRYGPGKRAGPARHGSLRSQVGRAK